MALDVPTREGPQAVLSWNPIPRRVALQSSGDAQRPSDDTLPIHGHQEALASDTLASLSHFFVRNVYGLFQIVTGLGRTIAARDACLRALHELDTRIARYRFHALTRRNCLGSFAACWIQTPRQGHLSSREIRNRFTRISRSGLADTHPATIASELDPAASTRAAVMTPMGTSRKSSSRKERSDWSNGALSREAGSAQFWREPSGTVYSSYKPPYSANANQSGNPSSKIRITSCVRSVNNVSVPS